MCCRIRPLSFRKCGKSFHFCFTPGTWSCPSSSTSPSPSPAPAVRSPPASWLSKTSDVCGGVGVPQSQRSLSFWATGSTAMYRCVRERGVCALYKSTPRPGGGRILGCIGGPRCSLGACCFSCVCFLGLFAAFISCESHKSNAHRYACGTYVSSSLRCVYTKLQVNMKQLTGGR